MASAAFGQVDISDQLSVAPHTGALEGKTLVLELNPAAVVLDLDPDDHVAIESASTGLDRGQVEALRDACIEWLEHA
jgi:hypothetical protein